MGRDRAHQGIPDLFSTPSLGDTSRSATKQVTSAPEQRCRDSLAIAERLAAADRSNTQWQRDLSVSYNKLGDVLVAQGKRPQALLFVEVFMSDFDPKAFTLELDALGLKLTATRMVDGTIRINQWRMHEYWSNERRATDLWERTIAANDSNRQVLAEFLLELSYLTF